MFNIKDLAKPKKPTNDRSSRSFVGFSTNFFYEKSGIIIKIKTVHAPNGSNFIQLNACNFS